MWLFTLRQGLMYFYQDKRRFFWFVAQIFLAMTVCYLVIAIYCSAVSAEKQLAEGNLEHNIKTMTLVRPGAQPRFIYTDRDLENLATIVGSDLEMVFYVSFSSYWSVDKIRVPLEIYFSYSIPRNSFFLTKTAHEILFDTHSEFLFSTYGGHEFIDDLIQYIENPLVHELKSLSEDLILKHRVTSSKPLLTNEIIKNLPKALVFLPIDYFFNELKGDKLVNPELVFYYKDRFDPMIVTEVAKYLDDKYGNEYRFIYFSDVELLAQAIAELKSIMGIAAFLTIAIIAMIVLSLSGMVNSLIQRRLREFSIKLCMGVTIKGIAWEVIVCVTTPGVIGGILGLLFGSQVLESINFSFFEIQQSFSNMFISFSVILLIPLLACVVPYVRYRQIEPMSVLKVE